MLQLLINDIDYTSYLLANGEFNINRRIRDYSATLDIIVPFSMLQNIQPSVDVKIKRDNKIIFGGLINYIKYKEKTVDRVIIYIECTDYNIIPTRRTISAKLNIEPSNPDDPTQDWNRAGFVALEYAQILQDEGVTIGWVEPGAQIAETDLDEFEVMNLKEIFDELANASGYTWYISAEKKFYFGSSERFPVEHIEEERIIKRGNGFFNIQIEKELTNYANKVFVMGGEPDLDIPEENLSWDGFVKYVEEDFDEINYIKNLNNDSGVWGTVIRDTNIHTVEDAKNVAISHLGTYGKLPTKIIVSTKSDFYDVRDIVWVDYPEYQINNQSFIIESMDITFMGQELVYTIHLSSQQSTLNNREDFYSFMEKLVKEAKNKGIQKVNNGGGSTGEYDNLDFIDTNLNDIAFTDSEMWNWFNYVQGTQPTGVYTKNYGDKTYWITQCKEPGFIIITGTEVIKDNNIETLKVSFIKIEDSQTSYNIQTTKLINIPIMAIQV